MHSIENSYFHSIYTYFNKLQNLVRDQGVGSFACRPEAQPTLEGDRNRPSATLEFMSQSGDFLSQGLTLDVSKTLEKRRA
jgi:hypothetical protein